MTFDMLRLFWNALTKYNAADSFVTGGQSSRTQQGDSRHIPAVMLQAHEYRISHLISLWNKIVARYSAIVRHILSWTFGVLGGNIVLIFLSVRMYMALNKTCNPNLHQKPEPKIGLLNASQINVYGFTLYFTQGRRGVHMLFVVQFFLMWSLKKRRV